VPLPLVVTAPKVAPFEADRVTVPVTVLGLPFASLSSTVTVTGLSTVEEPLLTVTLLVPSEAVNVTDVVPPIGSKEPVVLTVPLIKATPVSLDVNVAVYVPLLLSVIVLKVPVTVLESVTEAPPEVRLLPKLSLSVIVTVVVPPLATDVEAAVIVLVVAEAVPGFTASPRALVPPPKVAVTVAVAAVITVSGVNDTVAVPVPEFTVLVNVPAFVVKAT
jgi:hypothetical protein